MKSRQPLPAPLHGCESFGQAPLQENLFDGPALDSLFETQAHGGNVSKRLGNGILRIRIEARSPKLFHNFKHLGAIARVNLTDHGVASGFRFQSDREGAPPVSMQPQDADLNPLGAAPSPPGLAKVGDLAAKLDEV